MSLACVRGARGRVWFGALIFVFATLWAAAHEPFDLSTRITVHADRIEAVATLGTGAARQWLKAAGCSEEQITNALRAAGASESVSHAPALAARLFKLENDQRPLAAQSVTSVSEGMEVIFTIVYPRAAAGVLHVHAIGYEHIAGLRSGSLMVVDQAGTTLAATRLSRTQLRLAIPLAAKTKERVPKP